jgi:predicted secreted Zn-dependent protease
VTRGRPRTLPRCAALALLLPLLPAAADVRIAERQSHYVLDANTLPALRAQMAQRLRAPRGETPRSHGLTSSRIEVRRDLLPMSPTGCRVRSIEVRLALEVTLPRWHPSRTPAQRMRIPVERMMQGLATHEAGHRRNAIAAANAIERKLDELPDAADCTQASRAIERIVRRELVRLHARDMTYDARTGSGRTQGAVLEVQDARATRRPGSALR